MKKTVLLCILSTAMCLTACGTDPIAGAPETGEFAAEADMLDIAAEEPDADPAEGVLCGTYWWTDNSLVSVSPEQERYRPDTEEIRVNVTNKTDAEFCFSESMFRLYRMENGREVKIPYAEGRDCFTCMAQIAPPQDTTVFTAKIAAHYDLPLPEGVYNIHIGDSGELVTSFEIAADAPLPSEPEPEQKVTVSTRNEIYGQGVKEIRVFLTNEGTETADVSFADFGLEQFLGEAVSYTPFSREPVEHFADIRGVQLEPGQTYEWKVSLSDFGIEAAEEGDYAVFYNGQEAKFSVGTLPENE